MALRLGDGVERLPGIGPARARSLEKLGLATVEDLLRYFPRDYAGSPPVFHRGGGPGGHSGVPGAAGGGATPPLPHPQGAGAGEGPPGGRHRQRHRHLL